MTRAERFQEHLKSDLSSQHFRAGLDTQDKHKPILQIFVKLGDTEKLVFQLWAKDLVTTTVYGEEGSKGHATPPEISEVYSMIYDGVEALEKATGDDRVAAAKESLFSA